MTRLISLDGNGGVSGQAELDKYELVAVSHKGDGLSVFRYEYDTATHGASDTHPAKIVVRAVGAEAPLVDGLPTIGTLGSMRFLDGDGNLILKTRDLLFNLERLAGVDPADQYQAIFSNGVTFVGSDDSAAVGHDGDVIVTGAGDDLVRARGGDDDIIDMGGEDTYRGGPGVDIVSYETIDAWVQVNLHNGKSRDGNAIRDKLYGIEGVRGSIYDDNLFGDAGDNVFQGLNGHDYIKGRAGFDEVSYLLDDAFGGTSGIVADMRAGTVVDGFGDTDELKNIEHIRGTDHGDLFIDAGGAQHYSGEGGDDTFRLRRGDDTVLGGDGADRFKFFGAFGDDTIGDFDQAEGDRIRVVGVDSLDDVTLEGYDGGTRILFAGNSIDLVGVSEADIDASYFLF